MKLACTLTIICLLLLPSICLAQTRGRRPTTRRRAPAPAATARQESAILRDARTRVADQIKTLTRFLYLYGRISNTIETTEDQARRSGTSAAEATALTDKSKAALRGSLRNVREGLDQLEVYFRTTPEVERFYIRLAGVAAGAADAETKLAANQLDQAGRSLLEVVNRLADVLQEM